MMNMDCRRLYIESYTMLAKCFDFCIGPVLEAPHLGMQPKQGLYKKPTIFLG
jgi:hypothetical protein